MQEGGVVRCPPQGPSDGAGAGGRPVQSGGITVDAVHHDRQVLLLPEHSQRPRDLRHRLQAQAPNWSVQLTRGLAYSSAAFDEMQRGSAAMAAPGERIMSREEARGGCSNLCRACCAF